jgi:manganese transport protein
MSKILQLTLGVLTAVGGFIDIGELVFTVQAGVKFGYSLVWALVVGTIGIIAYSELSGRIAAVAHKASFDVVKERLPRSLSLITLLLSTALNVLTCAAEIGGVAIALQLLTGLDNMATTILTVGVLLLVVWLLPFKALERSFGLLGLAMLVFVLAAIATHPSFQEMLAGVIPNIPSGQTPTLFTYLYFVVGIIGSTMMPYEVYFYSSGGIEEKWTPKDLTDNKITAGVGMSLGAVLAVALIVLGHQVLQPAGITPELHSTVALLVSTPLGKLAFYVALLGIIFTIGGAAVETCLSGAYNISQYFGFKWGRSHKPEETPRFTAVWVIIFALAFAVMLFGIDPVDLVEYAVIFSVLALPLTYYPIMVTAADKKIMGEHASGPLSKTVSRIYFVIVVLIAVSAIPLMVLSHMGKR